MDNETNEPISGEWVLHGGPNYSGTVNTGVDGTPWRIMNRGDAVARWRDLYNNGYHQGFPLWGDGMAPGDAGVMRIDDPATFGVGDYVTAAELTGREWCYGAHTPGYSPNVPYREAGWADCRDALWDELADQADHYRELAEDDGWDDDERSMLADAVDAYTAAVREVALLADDQEWSADLPDNATSAHDLGLVWELARVDQ